MSDYPRGSTREIDATLTNKNDGSAIQLGASIQVKKDGGAYAAGGGTLVFKDGYAWEYTPTAAETDADHVAFKFGHPDAIDNVINIYPTRMTDQARINQSVFFDNEDAAISATQKVGNIDLIDGALMHQAFAWMAAGLVGNNTGADPDVFTGLDNATTRLSVQVAGTARTITRS